MEGLERPVEKPTGSSEVLGNRKGLRARGMPIGSTEASGSGVGKSSGSPTGSTEANGFDSSKAGGRPTGSTGLKGYSVGLSGGVYASTQSNALFKTTWNSLMIGIVVLELLMLTTVCYVHVGLELLSRAFDSQPLAILGFVIPLVEFYGTLAMPITQASLRLLME